MENILPAFFIGLLGSFHCLGMCGPLALAVPVKGSGRLTTIFNSLIYNIGRISTYMILGAIVGTIGGSIRFSGYQTTLSISMGVLLLLIYFLPKKVKNIFLDFAVIKTISANFKKLFHKALNIQNKSALLILGFLNGLLPCGLVYVALAGSLGFAGYLESGAYMLVFGLGTLPMMFSVFVIKDVIPLKIRKKITRLIPIGVAVVAVLLIMRGLSLGIPYISPVLPNHVAASGDCCK